MSSLADEIKALSPPARLRLAADLLERRKPEIAHAIAESVTVELGAAIALAKVRGGK